MEPETCNLETCKGLHCSKDIVIRWWSRTGDWNLAVLLSGALSPNRHGGTLVVFSETGKRESKRKVGRVARVARVARGRLEE